MDLDLEGSTSVSPSSNGFETPLQDVDEFSFFDSMPLEHMLSEDLNPETPLYNFSANTESLLMGLGETPGFPFETMPLDQKFSEKSYHLSHFNTPTQSQSPIIKMDQSITPRPSSTHLPTSKSADFTAGGMLPCPGGARLKRAPSATFSQHSWSACQPQSDQSEMFLGDISTSGPCSCLLIMVHLLETIDSSVELVEAKKLDIALATHKATLSTCIDVVNCSRCMVQLEYIKLLSLVYEKVVNLCELITNTFITLLQQRVSGRMGQAIERSPLTARASISGASGIPSPQSSKHETLPPFGQKGASQLQQQVSHGDSIASLHGTAQSTQLAGAAQTIAFGHYIVDSEIEQDYIYHFLIGQQQRRLGQLLVRCRREHGSIRNGVEAGTTAASGGNIYPGSGSAACIAKMAAYEKRVKDMIVRLQEAWNAR